MQAGVHCRIGLRNIVGIFDEVAQVRIVVVADGVSIEISSLAIFMILRILSSGICISSASLAESGFFIGLLKVLARDAVHLVDGFNHMYRNADGTRLIGNRTGDCLADPPGCVGGEFIDSAVFELVDRFHQDRCSLPESDQGTVSNGLVYFWAMEMTRRKFA